jgi:small subunit ribosomal protein S6
MLMREYETLYILRPDLAEDAIGKVNERLTGVLDREGAKVLRLNVWGKKKLAYEVKKNPKGVYIHLSYLSQPSVVSEFERNLRMLEPVIKYQTVRIAENVDVDKRVAEQEAQDRARTAAETQKPATPKSLESGDFEDRADFSADADETDAAPETDAEETRKVSEHDDWEED